MNSTVKDTYPFEAINDKLMNVDVYQKGFLRG